MNDFNAQDFMHQTIDEPLDAERRLIPPGEYEMRIGDFDESAFESFPFTYQKGPKAGEEGILHKFTCPIHINSDDVKKATGMDNPTVYHQCTLDVDDTGKLQWGPNRNIGLGQLRHATGQNSPGTWTIGDLRGAGPFMGKVVHRSGKRKDGTKFTVAEVERFAPVR